MINCGIAYEIYVFLYVDYNNNGPRKGIGSMKVDNNSITLMT